MKKMSNYKQQIEEKLIENNWEIIEIDSSEEWWVDEHWKIKSIKHVARIQIVIVFKVDPLFEGNRKKGQGIGEIDALTIFPKDWIDRTNSIALLSMTKGKFNIKLEEFLKDLNDYRNQIIEK